MSLFVGEMIRRRYNFLCAALERWNGEREKERGRQKRQAFHNDKKLLAVQCTTCCFHYSQNFGPHHPPLPTSLVQPTETLPTLKYIYNIKKKTYIYIMLKFYTLTDIRHYKHYLYRHNIIVMPHEIIKPNTSHGSNKPLHWDRG